jgi:membrane protein required for colicin V production
MANSTIRWKESEEREMNIADYILLALMLVAIFIGSRRGLFSGIMGILGLSCGIIFSVNYVDWTTQKVLSHMKVSTIMIAFLSFIVIFVLVYLSVKFLGYLFYKVASLKPLGHVDKVGGALMGAFQGWILLGFILFLFVFLPLPDSFVTSLDDSFFGPGMRGTVTLIYEESGNLHPQNRFLVEKIKNALLTKPGEGARGFSSQSPSENPRVQRIIQAMEGYFGE